MICDFTVHGPQYLLTRSLSLLNWESDPTQCSQLVHACITHRSRGRVRAGHGLRGSRSAEPAARLLATGWRLLHPEPKSHLQRQDTRHQLLVLLTIAMFTAAQQVVRPLAVATRSVSRRRINRQTNEVYLFSNTNVRGFATLKDSTYLCVNNHRLFLTHVCVCSPSKTQVDQKHSEDHAVNENGVSCEICARGEGPEICPTFW